jgi:uncharacterized membrane protein
VRDRLLNRWLRFRASFWFVPLAMTLSAIALSFATVALDDAIDWTPSSDSPFGYAGRPDGARALLSTIAGSTITVAATAFSVTIAALVLASSQFGPRLIRNFIADTANQVVLGTFIGTFAYCLLVLRTVNGTEGEEFVPQISITVGVGLAMACIVVLIYFIHHVATSIQATSIITSVSHDLERSIDRLYRVPNRTEETDIGAGDGREEFDLNESEAEEVSATRGGYIQTVDLGRIVALAGERHLVIKLRYHAGRFVLQRGTIALVWPEDSVDDYVEREINGAFTLGASRTPTQDVEFAMDQLVEIAVRALSPGVNDPFTALTCIDRLGSALVRVVEREFPDPMCRDEDGNLRVVAAFAGFGSVVDAAFNQIRQYGHDSPAILMRLLETIAIVARRTENEEQRDVLLRHVEMIRRATESLPEENDRRDASERYREVVRALHRVRAEEQEEAAAGISKAGSKIEAE